MAMNLFLRGVHDHGEAEFERAHLLLRQVKSMRVAVCLPKVETTHTGPDRPVRDVRGVRMSELG